MVIIILINDYVELFLDIEAQSFLLVNKFTGVLVPNSFFLNFWNCLEYFTRGFFVHPLAQ